MCIRDRLKNDCYIPGQRNEDPADLAREASVEASSQKSGFEAAQVLSGIARSEEGGQSNLWCSNSPRAAGQWLRLDWKRPVQIRQIRLTLDPDLSEERCISVSKAFPEKEPVGVAPTLLKDYPVTASLSGEPVWTTQVAGNYQRLNILEVPNVTADRVQIRVDATNGAADARVFEVRVY